MNDYQLETIKHLRPYFSPIHKTYLQDNVANHFIVFNNNCRYSLRYNFNLGEFQFHYLELDTQFSLLFYLTNEELIEEYQLHFRSRSRHIRRLTFRHT